MHDMNKIVNCVLH